MVDNEGVQGRHRRRQAGIVYVCTYGTEKFLWVTEFSRHEADDSCRAKDDGLISPPRSHLNTPIAA